jgi:serine phosphatase RsbU (regulator of sigma subunit)
MMLTLDDFFHLPELDTWVERMVTAEKALIIVAGFDPPLTGYPAASTGLLPSGRSTIFRILMRQILAAHRQAHAIVVTEARETVRLPRGLYRRVRTYQVNPQLSYRGQIDEAVRQRPGLLVIDKLCSESAAGLARAAGHGLRILTQLDTVLRGAEAIRHCRDLGLMSESSFEPLWVLYVQRLRALCLECKRQRPATEAQLGELCSRYPHLRDSEHLMGPFFDAEGCRSCHHTGRYGDVALFDIYRIDHDPQSLAEPRSLLSLEAYALRLASLGYLSLGDVIHLDADQLSRLYGLLTASDTALMEATATLERRVVEIETANRVLRQRTEALVSLQQIGNALITSTNLQELAGRVCRHTRELGGADRVVLYYLRPDGDAEILAVSGWDPELVRQRVDPRLVSEKATSPLPCEDLPPGIQARHPDVEGVALRAGLRVPLWAQNQQVGLMIVHTGRAPRFEPGQEALLQTFAFQAALAIQRTGLIEALQDKIVQLEAAQAELIQKERLEKELELAREVQQSVLPRLFPDIPGYVFAGYNEPARQVGGDFYDVFRLDDRRFGLVMADVSDKGMAAALYMALTRSVLLAEAHRESSPRQVLLNVHRLLLELGDPNMFVTIFYGVIDTATRRLVYARAGHDWPLLFRDGEHQLLTGAGTFLGFSGIENLHLAEQVISLRPGDRLLLYTDGLTDALSANGHAFGRERLASLIEGSAHLSAGQLCSHISQQLVVHQRGREQFDDMTLLVVDVQGDILG